MFASGENVAAEPSRWRSEVRLPTLIPVAWRKAAAVLWFPVFFAIALPLTFQTAFHQPTPHNEPIAVVGSSSQVRLVGNELARVRLSGFDVRPSPSVAAAAAAVRDRKVVAAYVGGGVNTVYLARAASAIRANYLQGVFARIAAQAGSRAPLVVDLVPLASGDGGTGIFFFVFPLMMAGLITAIVLLQLPTWGIGRRVVVVAAVGAISSAAAYLTAVELHVVPGKVLLLAYAFLLTQVYGQLMVGAAPLLKQFFLPVSLTLALILSVPSSGGTVNPDLLPTPFRDLSSVLPLAQAVKITRSVAYFHDAAITRPTLLLGLWTTAAAATVAIAWQRQQSRARTAAAPRVPSLRNPRTAGGSAPTLN
jgi:hypothetical protein